MVGYRLLWKGNLPRERNLEKTSKWNLYGKYQAIWFFWLFGSMTKDLSLKCIVPTSLLYGLLNSQLDCSAYDKSMACMFYILVVIFRSQEFAGSSM